MQLILKLINNTHHENTYNILRNCILQFYELENTQIEQCVINRKGSLSALNSTKFARKISLFGNFGLYNFWVLPNGVPLFVYHLNSRYLSFYSHRIKSKPSRMAFVAILRNITPERRELHV